MERMNLLTEEQVADLAGFSVNEAVSAIVEMSWIVELYDNGVLVPLCEGEETGLVSVLNSKLSKLGLNIEKSHKGSLFDIAKRGGASMLKLLVAAMKGDKKTMMEIGNTQITFGQVLDFLLKLDMSYFHFVTPWIHTIDAVLGWELWANLQKRVGTASENTRQAVVKTFADAIQFLKDKAELLTGSLKNAVLNTINALDKTLSPDLKHI